MKLRRILAPVNGTAIDSEVIEFACSVAKRTKAEIYAIYVIEVKRSLPLDADMQPEMERGEQVLEQAEHIAEANDCRIQSELLQAREIGPAIVDEAIERSVDMVVLGLPFSKRIGEFELGKTASYVLKHAPCRVWVLREART
jgi:nucleotide-binding universal stress UspA family protein